ncbi:hypothetical protein ISCGN_023350 [Ixodes scapularis]
MSGAASSGVEQPVQFCLRQENVFGLPLPQLPHQEIQLVIPQHRPRRVRDLAPPETSRASCAAFSPFRGTDLQFQVEGSMCFSRHQHWRSVHLHRQGPRLQVPTFSQPGFCVQSRCVSCEFFLNVLMVQRRLPSSWRGAETTLITPINPAQDSSDFRSTTVGPVVQRIFHRILGKRASAAVALDFLQCSFQPYEGENLSVQPTTGVGQGDLLSSILLSMVVDEFLCSVDYNITIRSDSFVVDAMAFADELVVLASTQQGLQQQLDNLTAFLKLRGLAINVSKS